MPPVLSIQLFGGFQLTYRGAPLTTLNAPHLQSLLVYLLLHRETPHARQRIAFLLWPDSSDTQAQSNLRTLLRRLRQAWPASGDFFQVDNRTVQWRTTTSFMLDVDEFERAQATGARAELEHALSLYRGDLLPNCYDDWIIPERERLRQKFLQDTTQLIALLEAERRFNTALIHAQRLLQLDPLQESTYQLLMRLHAAHGDRANVVRTLHTCETVLAQELGLEPSPETRELFDRLQHAPPRAPAQRPPSETNNLPVPLTSFIGRVGQMTESKRLLVGGSPGQIGASQGEATGRPSHPPTARLLTLTGVGGSGKSRLALHIAGDLVDAYAQGVWWVELAPLSDPTLIPAVVASVLGINEQPGRALVATLADRLKAKQLLLVLDNCEHLVQACAAFASTLLHASAGLQILATSREALGISGETIYAVPPLALPGEVSESNWPSVAESDASRLFIERAQAVLPTFSLTQQNVMAVTRVCEQLDGIPLAIELAAARVKALSVEQIAARLEDRFTLLTVGDRAAPQRHQTLRALMDWSHDLLTEPERVLLRRLSVFAGGWTLAAAEAVCAGEGIEAWEVLDLLSHLLDKSLVAGYAQVAEPRYRMLETIRQYAREKLLDAGESERLRDQHLAYFQKLAERAEAPLDTAQRVEWIPRLKAEHDNLRAALEWACERDLEVARALAGRLSGFWYHADRLNEARTWYARVLGAGERTAKTEGTALAFLGAGWVSAFLMSLDDAEPLLEQSVALWRVLDDKARLVMAVSWLCFVKIHQGDSEAACAIFEANESTLRQFASPRALAWALNWWARALAVARGDYATAWLLLEQSQAVGQKGNDSGSIDTSHLGFWATQQGDYVLARQYMQKSLTRQRRASPASNGVGLGQVADVAYLQGEYTEARTLYDEALASFRALGDQAHFAHIATGLGFLAVQQGELERAAAIFAESLEIHRKGQFQLGTARCLAGYAGLRLAQGRVEQAVRLLASEVVYSHSHTSHIPIDRIRYERILAAAHAQLDEAVFNVAWAAGRRLTLEQAIKLAFSEE